MRREATPRKLIFALLLIAMLNHSLAIRLYQLPSSPSPSPSPVNGVPVSDVPKPWIGAIRKAKRRGSFPARCNAKCNQCEPCRPVEVSIRTTTDLEENEYYPQVWKCMCGNNIFSP